MNKKDKKIWLAIAIGIGLLILINGGYMNQLFAVYYSPSCDFITNAEGDYRSGTWISVDVNHDGSLEGYEYSGSASTSTSSGTFEQSDCHGIKLTTTPEGYWVVYYSGKLEVCKLESTTTLRYYRYQTDSSIAETTCPIDEPESDCSEGETSCQNNHLVTCGVDLFWNDPNPKEVGVCGVECLVTSDCDNFQSCSNDVCTFDQANLNDWLLAQTDLNSISISELTSRINSLDLTAEAQGELIADIDAKIDLSVLELTELINGLQTQVDAQADLIDSLNDKIDLSVSDLTTLINNLQSTVSGQATLISGLRTDVDLQADLITGLQATTSGQADLIALLESGAVNQGQIIAQLQDDLSLTDSELRDLITQVSDKADLTATEQGELISALDLRVIDLEDLVSALQTDALSQGELISALELSLSDQADLIAGLQTQIDAQAEVINGIDFDSISQQADLIDELELSISEQATLLTNLDLTYQELVLLVSSMQTDLTALQEELGFTQEDILTIKSQLANLSSSTTTGTTDTTTDTTTTGDFNDFFEEYEFWIIGILIGFAMIILLSGQRR